MGEAGRTMANQFLARVQAPLVINIRFALILAAGLLAALFGAVPSPARAQAASGSQEIRTTNDAPDSAADDSSEGVERIAAVVNDDVVSVYDIENRMKMLMATSGMPDTPEVRERLRPQ